jgi:hypothetical protein
MIRVVHPGSRIRMLTFYPSRIPDPGVKKAPDPGSGSATLRSSPSSTRAPRDKHGNRTLTKIYLNSLYCCYSDPLQYSIFILIFMGFPTDWNGEDLAPVDLVIAGHQDPGHHRVPEQEETESFTTR